MPFTTLVRAPFQAVSVAQYDRGDPTIAALDSGNYVIAWEQEGANESSGRIFQRLFDKDGNPLGKATRVDVTDNLGDYNPSVASLETGGWVIVWNTFRSADQYKSISVMAREYSAAGVAVANPVRVSPVSDDQQFSQKVTALKDGGFLVTWYDTGGDNGSGPFGSGAIMARAFNADFSPKGAAYRVNKTIKDAQGSPDVTQLSNGKIAISYQSAQLNREGERVTDESYVRIISADGKRVISNEIKIPVSGMSGVYDIAPLQDGGFVVTGWQVQRDGLDLSYAIRAFEDGNGYSFAEVFKSPSSGADIYEPQVTAMPDGGYVVSATVDVSGARGGPRGYEEIYIQRFDSDGKTLGDVQKVSSKAGSGFYHNDARITTLEDGRIALVWEGNKTYQANEDMVGTDVIWTRVLDAELVGSNRADTFSGTTQSDVMRGRNGNDKLNGLAGNDSISGGKGKDLVTGGTGRDSLFGGAGIDTLRGGNGSDQLSGDAAADKLLGDGGNDTLRGGNGSDHLNGGGGRDLLRGDAGKDILIGGGLADTLSGGAGNDRLAGQKGNDRLTGGAGEDVFVFARGGGTDRITDFQNNLDSLLFQGFGSNAAVLNRASKDGNDVRFSFVDGSQLIVENTTFAAVSDTLLD